MDQQHSSTDRPPMPRPSCSCCGAPWKDHGCVKGWRCGCSLLAAHCEICRKCANCCHCAVSNARAARAENEAAQAALKAWLKEPGSKTATPWGHFLKGWYAHKEYARTETLRDALRQIIRLADAEVPESVRAAQLAAAALEASGATDY